MQMGSVYRIGIDVISGYVMIRSLHTNRCSNGVATIEATETAASVKMLNRTG